MNTNKICAVIVTYNRLLLLKECIEALRNQTRPLNNILVINNDSTDGTTNWLNEQKDINVIHQENLGGAGGFHRGIKEAHEGDYDWIWVMDDDVIPYLNCVEELFKIIENPGYHFDVLQPDRVLFGQEKKRWRYGSKLNLKNPFLSLTLNPIRVTDFPDKDVFEIESFPFEGPLFNRKVIEKIGEVDYRFFINFDDTDYSIRVVKAGFKIGLVKKALLLKKLGFNQQGLKNDFKLFYLIRNSIILERKHMNFTYAIFRGFYKSIRMFSTFLYRGIRERKIRPVFSAFYNIFGAFIAGILFKLN
jgi:GT2 family glycosyltransferase